MTVKCLLLLLLTSYSHVFQFKCLHVILLLLSERYNLCTKSRCGKFGCRMLKKGGQLNVWEECKQRPLFVATCLIFLLSLSLFSSLLPQKDARRGFMSLSQKKNFGREGWRWGERGELWRREGGHYFLKLLFMSPCVSGARRSDLQCWCSPSSLIHFAGNFFSFYQQKLFSYPLQHG